MDALKDCTTAYIEGQIHIDEYRQQLAALILNPQYVDDRQLESLAGVIDDASW